MSDQSGKGPNDKNESNSENNVVPFPTHKVKTKKEKARALSERMNMAQKRTLFLSLLATVFVGTYLSNQLNDKSNSKIDEAGRKIAEQEGAGLRTFDEDLALAKKIGKDSLRDPASQGRAPTSDERLRDEFLKGRYKVVYQDGRVVEVELPKDSNVEPVIADDRPEILNHYREAMRIPAGEPVLVDKKEDSGYQIETYKIEDGLKDPSIVKFRIDRQERLYWMKVEGPVEADQ